MTIFKKKWRFLKRVLSVTAENLAGQKETREFSDCC